MGTFWVQNKKMYTFLKSLYPLKCLASPDHTFYNDTAFETVISELNRIRKNIKSFADKLELAGEKMESRDKEIGELYKIFER